MKTTILLSVLMVGTAFALKIPTPEIKGLGKANGTTTHTNVVCFLHEGRTPGTVDGQLIVSKSFLGLGVCLIAVDERGKLVFSCPLSGEDKEDATQFQFILTTGLLAGARLTVFSKEQMYDLPLSTVTIDNKTANHTSDGIRQPADGSPKPSR